MRSKQGHSTLSRCVELKNKQSRCKSLPQRKERSTEGWAEWLDSGHGTQVGRRNPRNMRMGRGERISRRPGSQEVKRHEDQGHTTGLRSRARVPEVTALTAEDGWS